MKYAIETIELNVCQLSIRAIAHISVPTKTQFTNVSECVNTEGYPFTFSTIRALWQLRKAIRKRVRELQSEAGGFELETTNFRPGLFGTRAQ